MNKYFGLFSKESRGKKTRVMMDLLYPKGMFKKCKE